MRADYLTYRTATSVSIRGLVLQLSFAVALTVYAFLGSDFAALTAAMFAGVGVLAWLVLAVVYDQHRRERVEAMEVDALAQSPVGGASAFEARDDFRPAAKRLAGLYRFFVPIASLVIGGMLVGLGILRFSQTRNLVSPDAGFLPKLPAWALGLGLAIAAAGFVFARYAAGMAKHPAWANLRAGAAFAVGSAIFGLAMAVAHFVDYAGPNVVVRYLPVLIAVAMVVVGAEVFLNFLLGIYRPRKAGETPRPAFDSRLLGFAAAPDRIAQSISEAVNYQLGFNVTSGWFYQLLSRWGLRLTGAGVLLLWLMSAVVVIRPHQRGMILRFGEVVREDVGPGAHLKAPWPIDRVYVPEYLVKDAMGISRVTDRTVTGIRTLQLGTSPPGTKEPILWTNEHVGDEVYQFVRATGAAAAPVADGGLAGGAELADLAMVSVEIPLQYVVSDVRRFDELTTPDDRDALLRTVAQREMTGFFQQATLDDVLGGKRRAMSEALKERIQGAYDALGVAGPDGKARGAGVQIVHVGISSVHPPKAAAAAFETPVQADQRREAVLEAARADEIESLTKVVGEVALARRIVAELDALDRLKEASGAAEAVREQELVVQRLLEGAGGEAAEKLAGARADRWERHMLARGRAARYQGQLALYAASPELYRATTYFDALRASMAGARVYIASEGVENQWYQVDLQDKDTGVDVFKGDTRPGE